MNRYPTISRDNNFDIVRLFAAFEVCIGHVLTHFNIWGGAYRRISGSDNFFHLVRVSCDTLMVQKQFP